jgi:hypothetical protein
MAGNTTPPPPLPYESPSDRRKAARESRRRTRGEFVSLPYGVRLKHGGEQAVGAPLKPQGLGDRDLQHHVRPDSSTTYDRGRVSNQDRIGRTAARDEKTLVTNLVQEEQ